MVAAFDTVISTGVLLVMFVVYGQSVTLTVLWIPLAIAVQVRVDCGCHGRDVGARGVLPATSGTGCLCSSRCSSSLPPSRTLSVKSLLRGAVCTRLSTRSRQLSTRIGKPCSTATRLDWSVMVPGIVGASLILIIGYTLFKRLETGFADFA